MFFSSSTLFKLLVWLFCVGVMVLVSEVQSRTLAGNARPDTRFCGFEDNVSIRRRRDAEDYNRWPSGANLTYRVGRGPTHGVLKDVDLGALVKLAFEEWAPHCGLHFTQIHSGEANITISFVQAPHLNCSNEVDGPLGVLAHVNDFPSKWTQSVEVHIHDEEEWSLQFVPGCVQFYGVLLHELGHALGLEHSSNERSIMSATEDITAPSLTDLQIDDKLRMRELYDITGALEDSIIDVAYKQYLFSLYNADIILQTSDEDMSNLLDFDYLYEASTTESSKEPSSSKNNESNEIYDIEDSIKLFNIDHLHEASTTESPKEPLSIDDFEDFIKLLNIDHLHDASTTESPKEPFSIDDFEDFIKLLNIDHLHDASTTESPKEPFSIDDFEDFIKLLNIDHLHDASTTESPKEPFSIDDFEDFIKLLNIDHLHEASTTESPKEPLSIDDFEDFIKLLNIDHLHDASTTESPKEPFSSNKNQSNENYDFEDFIKLLNIDHLHDASTTESFEELSSS